MTDLVNIVFGNEYQSRQSVFWRSIPNGLRDAAGCAMLAHRVEEKLSESTDLDAFANKDAALESLLEDQPPPLPRGGRRVSDTG